MSKTPYQYINLVGKNLQSGVDKLNESKVNIVNAVVAGCDNTGETNCTTLLQQLLDTYSTIYLPKGTYLIDKIVLPTHTSIIGEDRENTILKSAKSSEKSFFTIDNGAVQYCRLENFSIKGYNINDGQNGLYIEAKYDAAGYQGGLWYCTFKNLSINGFRGVGFALICPPSNSMLPIQVNYFEHMSVHTDVEPYPDSVPFLVEGQVQQNTFIRCGFGGGDYNKVSSGTKAAVFKRSKSADGTVGDCAGSINTFLECYFGQAEVGIYMERALEMCFVNTYFELTKLDIYACVSTNAYFVAPYFYGKTLFDGINIVARTNAFISVSDCSHDFGIWGHKIHLANCPYATDYLRGDVGLADAVKIEPSFVALNFNADKQINSLKPIHAKTIAMVNPSNGATATFVNGDKLITSTGADISVSSITWFSIEKLFDDVCTIRQIPAVKKTFKTVSEITA